MASPGTVALDEGVHNLNRFCALLAAVDGRLAEAVPALEASAEDLERTEGELRQAADDLEAALEQGADRLDSGREEASAALDELHGLVERVAQSRLEEAWEPVDAGAEALLAAGAQAGQRTDESLADVSAGGLRVLEEAVASLEAESAAEVAEAERELDGLGGFLTDLTERARADAEQTERALDETATSAAEEQAQLTDRFAQSQKQWDEAIDGGLLQGAGSGGASVQQAHQSWEGTAGQVADSLFAAVADLASAAEDVVDGACEAIGTDCEALQEGPGRALDDGVSEAAALVAAAEPLTTALETMLADLGVTLRVVAQVDALLKEMA